MQGLNHHEYLIYNGKSSIAKFVAKFQQCNCYLRSSVELFKACLQKNIGRFSETGIIYGKRGGSVWETKSISYLIILFYKEK